ncbi:MAG: 5-(carboxyamino)imidazole ribonucleotide mutase [Chitinophagaceae bacterium]|nr:5-(carboxyamino)imidazole ribonucleotide mutase [Chitinophagaceae bacterium]
MAAAAGQGQAHVADPAHDRGRHDNASILRCPPLSAISSSPAPPRVAVVMGSDSDLPTMQPAVAMLERFGVGCEVRVLSAHRTPLEMVAFAREARQRGLQVIIAGAGGAAHLPGMVASLTTLPVIGVPVQTRALSGVDSLHSIVQMPAGIPVATVAIGGGANAGLLAVQILATAEADASLAEALAAYRDELHGQVRAKDARLVEQGSAAYLEQMG